MKTTLVAAIAFAWSALSALAINIIRFESDTPLEVAVSRFNDMAALDVIGKDELPLTVDELIAAIRGVSLKEDAAMPQSYYEALQEIAITRTIPKGWTLDFNNGWNWQMTGKKREFDVWWVDLRPPNAKGLRNIRVRQRFIRCRILE